MGIFSKKAEGKKLGLVFDIGSSSVGGAVFEINKNKTPKIIFSIRESITFENKMDSDRFLLLTLKALDIIAKKISLSSVGNPTKIFCVLSSPWYVSETRIIKLEKNIPFIFTSKLADGLIQKEISLFEKEHLAEFKDTPNKIRMIEFKNIKTMLNGYVTKEPFNKKCQKLEMNIFVSMSGEKVLKKIEESIFKHFHPRDIRFSSFTIASFTIVRDMFMSQEDFLLMDICGEMTDISIIKKEALISSVSFPLGRNFMIRKTATKLNCSLDEAKTYISIYMDGHASDAIFKKIGPVMDKLKTEWLDLFQKSLVDISKNTSIPSTIFITVDQDFADFFGDIINREQFNQYISTISKFKIIFLNNQILHGNVDFKSVRLDYSDKENIDRDPFLIIESVYINRFIC